MSTLFFFPIETMASKLKENEECMINQPMCGFLDSVILELVCYVICAIIADALFYVSTFLATSI